MIPEKRTIPWKMACILFTTAIILLVYGDVRHFDFINFDDDMYVTGNPDIHQGLTLQNVKQAFIFSQNGTYWHPLTWLSHMLDCHMFGLNPGLHHLTNLIFHVLNASLLFIIFNAMTGNLWRSAFVAALFAVHPINVESVAWIAERKNVLSTFFWMLTLLSYLYYAQKPNIGRYVLLLVPFILGLLAKPMLVTLPCVLLLLDFWPLKRLRLFSTQIIYSSAHPKYQPATFFKLIMEKIPLMFFSLVSIGVSLFSVHLAHRIISRENAPMLLRLENMFLTDVKYMVKFIWPNDLAVFYPFPKTIADWQVLSAVLLITIITMASLLLLKKFPYLLIGWLWYMGTLLPVSGISQHGLWPEMADRFAYVPFIGLFIIAGWGGADLLSGFTRSRLIRAVPAAVIIIILIFIAHRQAAHWENSIHLFESALQVNPDNYLAHNNLGVALNQQSRTDAAASHFLQAIRIKPDYEKAHYNIGITLDKMGRPEEATAYFKAALQIRPDYFDAHYSIAVDLEKQGRTEEAIRHYNTALAIRPEAKTYNNLGNAMGKLGNTAEAIYCFSKAIELKPDFAMAHYNLANAQDKSGRTDAAISSLLDAIKLKPDFEMAHSNLAGLYLGRGQTRMAIEYYQTAININPDRPEVHYNLGIAFLRDNKIAESIDQFQKAIALDPGYKKAQYALTRIQGLTID